VNDKEIPIFKPGEDCLYIFFVVVVVFEDSGPGRGLTRSLVVEWGAVLSWLGPWLGCFCASSPNLQSVKTLVSVIVGVLCLQEVIYKVHYN
jgi:hypothetical protein